uniref:Uncharacterized protein n=1 Tax=Knipowitschia caucasica TaxID=637954 RepID=A0AAV2LWG9_KNICA
MTSELAPCLDAFGWEELLTPRASGTGSSGFGTVVHVPTDPDPPMSPERPACSLARGTPKLCYQLPSLSQSRAVD